MFINEALTKLKNLKSKATRTEIYINECAVYYEDDHPEHVYSEEMLIRNSINEEIIKLKANIQNTNAVTLVNYKNQTITLSELILRNAQLRIEMAFVTHQMTHSNNERNPYASRTKDNIKKVLALGCDKAIFKKQLDELEKEKEEIERVMALVNSSTSLV